jgi:hypothetical protein
MKCFVDVPDLDVDGFKHIGDGKIRLYKGGGGGGSQTTTSYSTNLPEYAKPYYQELLKQTGRSIFETDSSGNVTGVKKFEPYEGQRIAGETPEQQRVRQEVLGMGPRGEFDYAGRGLTGAGAIGLDAASRGLSGAFADTSQLMSPYLQGALNPQLQELRRQSDLFKRQDALSSMRSGAFGGARQALMATERERNATQQMSDVIGKGYQTAFEAAAARQAELGRLGLAGLQAGTEASRGLAAVGTAAQESDIKRLAAQEQASAQERALSQEQLDINYQQEMERRNYERSLLEYYSNILRGTAGALGSTQVQYQPRPSFGQQAAGLGIAGLGAYLRG